MNYNQVKCTPIDKVKNYLYYQNLISNDNNLINQENMNFINFQNSDLKYLKSENRKNKESNYFM
jgi:hypothetical protein